MNNIREYLPLLVDYTALVYHEARNVRHLIQQQTIEPESWKYLVALPVNREKAWKEQQSICSEAQKAETVRATLLPFERRFKVTLDQLQVLYDHPAWRNAAYGGNAWKKITELVRWPCGRSGKGPIGRGKQATCNAIPSKTQHWFIGDKTASA